jgi:O-antigen biosynthesis protein WbqP
VASSIFILIEDGLPLFFKQKRIGINKNIFTIYKIRTLKTDAPNVGTHDLEDCFKLKAGRIIRALKLDEFPQLFNVLKGEINLVGPRPGLESQIELEQARTEAGIFIVKPGITGLAQVLGYDMSEPVTLAAIDKIYIKNKSISLDLLILMGTFISFPRNYLASKFGVILIKKI